MQKIIRCGVLGILGALLIALSSRCLAAELFIPKTKARTGQQIQLPVMVDHLDNLAGIKLVITYDPNILTYKNAEKTTETSPFMFIVNDKTPGKLIVVMANPTGIKGDQIPLVMLIFDVKKEIGDVKQTWIAIPELQMKDDQLKDISHTVKTEPITITHS